MDTARIGKAEHVSLEADIDIAAPPVRPPHRKVRATFVLKNRLRDRTTELSLLDEHYLQVHVQRARAQPRKYSIDLRFLNSTPSRIRRIAWVWLSAGILLLIGAAGAAAWGWLMADIFFTSPGFIAAGVMALAAIGLTALGLRLTTESLNFTSVHGGATLVSVIGGLGSTKKGKAFFVSMIKSIAAAKTERRQPKQQLLRDEMREHHRLRELGVLSETEYEASKARILKSHA